MFESLKDPATGQIKKPILYSLIGGGGLLVYLLLSGKSGSSGVVSTGLTTPLTPDLTGLADALKTLDQSNQGGIMGVAASGTAASDTAATSGSGTIAGYSGGGAVSTTDVVAVSGGASDNGGAAGGGGSGTGVVIAPIAKSPSVYGGLAKPTPVVTTPALYSVTPSGTYITAIKGTSQPTGAPVATVSSGGKTYSVRIPKGVTPSQVPTPTPTPVSTPLVRGKLAPS